MDQILCVQCNTLNPKDSHFCSNCGKALKEKEVNVSIIKQTWLYIIAFLLPPLGLIPGIKYLRKDNEKIKKVGLVLIVLTIISVVVQVLLFSYFYKDFVIFLNQQVGSYDIPQGL